MTNSLMPSPQVSSRHRAPLPSQQLTEFYASIPTPVTIVSAFNSELRPMGTTVGSYCTVSLAPPLAIFCLLPSSEFLASLVIGKNVTIHFPRPEQADIELVKRFAGKGGPAKFENVRWRNVNGAPAIDDIPCASASINTVSDLGDHRVVTVEFSTVAEPLAAPLLYLRRRFGTFDVKEIV